MHAITSNSKIYCMHCKKSGIREVRQSGDPLDSLVSSENFPPTNHLLFIDQQTQATRKLVGTRLLKTPAHSNHALATGCSLFVFLHRPEATSLISQLIVAAYRFFLHACLPYSLNNIWLKFYAKLVGCGHAMT